MPNPNDDFIEDLLAAAGAHGQLSEPDHEVGDLQDALRACWSIMTPEQRTHITQLVNSSMSEWLTAAKTLRSLENLGQEEHSSDRLE